MEINGARDDDSVNIGSRYIGHAELEKSHIYL